MGFRTNKSHMFGNSDLLRVLLADGCPDNSADAPLKLGPITFHLVSALWHQKGHWANSNSREVLSPSVSQFEHCEQLMEQKLVSQKLPQCPNFFIQKLPKKIRPTFLDVRHGQIKGFSPFRVQVPHLDTAHLPRGSDGKNAFGKWSTNGGGNGACPNRTVSW